MSYAQGYASFDPYGGLTEEEEASAGGPYWLRHWRGQLPLARSYWVNGFAVNVAIAVGEATILALAQERQLALVAWAFVVFVILSLALRTWSFVGIWRSANHHVERGGSALWAFVARAVVGLAALAIVATAPALWSQVREMVLIASGHDPIGVPATIKVSANGNELTLDGNITAGLNSRLAEALQAAPNAHLLTLNSHGGRILEALAMVDQIKARRLDTRVLENCESACTLLFLAGTERSSSPLAQIGFHQPNFPGLSAEGRQQMIQNNSQDYRAAGMSDAFVARIMATPPEKVWYPTYAEMTEAGVVNSVSVSRKRDPRESARLELALDQATKNINARRGNMIDNVTQLKGALVRNGRIVVDLLVTKQLPITPVQMANKMLPVLRDKLCSGPDAELIAAGGKYEFDYRYQSGREAGTVVVEHCY
jgi:hypothetical protein